MQQGKSVVKGETINPLKIISKYYDPDSIAYHILVEHSRMVAKKSLDIAGRLKHMRPDPLFIEEAALLHDIGIFLTEATKIGCRGEHEYICHGYLGRELLEREGLPRHALVCERHVGVGLSCSDIEEWSLPIPRRDMIPVSLEEKIICYADKFFSKKIDGLHHEKAFAEVRQEIAKYGWGPLSRFDEMNDIFNR